MDYKILFGAEGVRISIGDVAIHALTMADLAKRLRFLRQVFERCRQFNLKLNKGKCEFGVRQISILGHVVSANGIEPDTTKTEAIKATPPPENVSDLRSCLGACGLFQIMQILLNLAAAEACLKFLCSIEKARIR